MNPLLFVAALFVALVGALGALPQAALVAVAVASAATVLAATAVPMLRRAPLPN